jgi:hypothetical protein
MFRAFDLEISEWWRAVIIINTAFFCHHRPEANSELVGYLDKFTLSIRNEDPGRTSMLDAVLRFITVETESAQVGSDVIVDKLSEIPFIHVVRACMQQTDVKTGLLAALSDARLGRALKALHEDPAYH